MTELQKQFLYQAEKPDRHSLRSCTISLRAALFIKRAGSSLLFTPIWSGLFGPKGKGLSEFQFIEIPRRKQSPEILKIIGAVLIGLPALWFFLYLLGTVQIIGPGL